jgi:hypothetical protein
MFRYVVVLRVVATIRATSPSSPLRDRRVADSSYRRGMINLADTISGRPLALQFRPCPKLILKYKFAVIKVLLHDHELTMVDITQVFEILHTEVIPFHKEYSSHQSMRDEYAYTGKIVLIETTPKRIIETRNPIVGVSSTLAVWYAVEEVSVVCPLLPHAFHLCSAWLEISEVLFSQPWFFIYFDCMSRKRRRCRIIARQGGQNAFCCLTCTPVRRSEEMEGIVRAEEGSEFAACFEGLLMAFRCETDAVVWHSLMDVAVLVSFGLGVPYEDD